MVGWVIALVIVLIAALGVAVVLVRAGLRGGRTWRRITDLTERAGRESPEDGEDQS